MRSEALASPPRSPFQKLGDFFFRLFVPRRWGSPPRSSSQRITDSISPPVTERLFDPIRIDESDMASLERAKKITRDFITKALVVVLGLESGSLLGASAEVRGLDRSVAPYIEFSYKRRNTMETDVASVVGGNERFALDLYARLRTEQSGNLFFSPSSISTALAMTYAGARGDTESEMAKVLHFTLSQDKLHPGFASLNKTLDGNGEKRGYRLHGANRLWGQQGYSFLPEFLTITRTHYDAELAEVDFARQTEQARQQINTWVEERTQGKIKDLIPPGIVTPLTCLVLTNAIYFKGDWTKPFDNKVTKDAPFQITSQQRTDVPMMQQQGDFRYWAGDGLKILELPYGRGDLSMLVLLPAETGGLPDLEARLTSENLCRWLMNVREQPVRVFLPRFKLTSQFRLDDTLKAMGMLLAFGRADFSGMTGKPDLFISAVIHKAFVDVNEEGTEAAAATAVIMKRGLAIPRQPAEFRADHPFVFLIRHNRTGSILFLGRLMNPKQ